MIKNEGYDCWLGYRRIENPEQYKKFGANVVAVEKTPIIMSAKRELIKGLKGMLGVKPLMSDTPTHQEFIILGAIGKSPLIDEHISEDEKEKIGEEGYILKAVESFIIITAKTDKGVLYGTYHILRLIQTETSISGINIIENPKNPLRIINQWDNLDGSIERGYAGCSILYDDLRLVKDRKRIRDYARLLSSVGINGIVINNVNVRKCETMLISYLSLSLVAEIAKIFRKYGIKIFLSINFASPIRFRDLSTADPLDERVIKWWNNRVAEIYERISDFGGFLVKADSEFNPGPYKYNRTHAEGANMLAEALQPFGGIVIWRCFVYNCLQDWRDQSTDRAKAAYDNFKPLDGKFNDNVVLQVKNGPMDFQVREPVSPLLGGLEYTNQTIELQITQEYTGQQIHLCYLVPQWKEVLDFDTYAKGEGSTVKKVVDGSLFNRKYCGFAAVSNIGDDDNWTGHVLAQANLYGYGRLAWNPDLSAEEITKEWVRLTFTNEINAIEIITQMLMNSWRIYENYNAPLGIGWMVNPDHHYGPSVDGYEYSKWGTYHRADHLGIGIDRTVKSGTGYTGQYHAENMARYESIETCPDELLLFFHHVPYTHRLKSGETVIQHIYNTHFEGVEQVIGLKKKWLGLKNVIKDERFEHVLKRLEEQVEHAKEWRDVINTYFFRKSGIKDEFGRKIY